MVLNKEFRAYSIIDFEENIPKRKRRQIQTL